MRQILGKDFYTRPTLTVAQELLGKYLVRKLENGTKIAAMITEVEAYDGFEDRASHASRGKTQRTEVMFGPGGVWYVYLIYGMYEMLNIIVGPKDYPAAILIRGVEGVSGPGRLTRDFKITRAFNKLPAIRQTGLYIEDRGAKIKKSQIKTSPRIGIGYAGPVWSEKEYRFFLK